MSNTRRNTRSTEVLAADWRPFATPATVQMHPVMTLVKVTDLASSTAVTQILPRF